MDKLIRTSPNLSSICVKCSVRRLLLGIMSAPTWLNVVSDDADVLISIGSRVLVPETDHVTQFVHHNAKLVTVFADGYGLGTPSAAAHVGAAPVNQKADTQIQTV